MKFSIKDFFSKHNQIRRKLWIWSHLLKNSLMENFYFCAVEPESVFLTIDIADLYFLKRKPEETFSFLFTFYAYWSPGAPASTPTKDYYYYY